MWVKAPNSAFSGLAVLAPPKDLDENTRSYPFTITHCIASESDSVVWSRAVAAVAPYFDSSLSVDNWGYSDHLAQRSGDMEPVEDSDPDNHDVDVESTADLAATPEPENDADLPNDAREGQLQPSNAASDSDQTRTTFSQSMSIQTHHLRLTQARFDALMSKHRSFEAKSARDSGTDERETRLIQVLTDLTAKVDSHNTARAKATADVAGAEQAKSQAGEVVRAPAVSRLQLGKRRAEEGGAVDGDDATPSGRQNKSPPKPAADWSTTIESMRTERSNMLNEFVQMQQAELRQRQNELEFER
ncbi:hypothetical protein ON010_g9352 [Phytophthora cinnamomi]|nr:hypothetical protein ON010_g9352 [Phytophthora cinnamomi]